MKRRALSFLLSCGLISLSVLPLRAQIRSVPVSPLPLSLSAPPVQSFQGISVSPFAAASFVPTILPVTLTASPEMPVSPAVFAGPSAAQALGALSADSPAGAPALDGLSAGRLVFDGAALSGSQALPAAQPEPAAAPRGETLEFNDQVLPTRMFSDKTKISPFLIRAIDATKTTLEIAIYELAIREVGEALQRAKDRGVRVRIVMDQTHLFPEKKGQRRSPEVQALLDEGFELKMLHGGDMHGLMHNKFALFDGALLETGSYNWARAADDQHHENALFLNEADRLASYGRYWDWLWSQAKPVNDKKAPSAPVAGPHGHGPDLPPAPQDLERPIRFNEARLPLQAFTPKGTAALIASAIDAARQSVVIANFSFTNDVLIQALRRAKDRGVKIRIVFDRDQYKFLKEMAEMRALGFDVRLSDGKSQGRGVMHNKFAVFDGRLVETGSFNWTTNGERNNYENALFLDAPDDAAGFAAYFERLWGRASPATDADHPSRIDPAEHPEGFNPHAF